MKIKEIVEGLENDLKGMPLKVTAFTPPSGNTPGTITGKLPNGMEITTSNTVRQADNNPNQKVLDLTPGAPTPGAPGAPAPAAGTPDGQQDANNPQNQIQVGQDLKVAEDPADGDADAPASSKEIFLLKKILAKLSGK